MNIIAIVTKDWPDGETCVVETWGPFATREEATAKAEARAAALQDASGDPEGDEYGTDYSELNVASDDETGTPASPAADAPVQPRYHMLCSHCGSANVTRDANATWCVDTQAWELAGVFDSSTCEACCEERSLSEIDENVACCKTVEEFDQTQALAEGWCLMNGEGDAAQIQRDDMANTIDPEQGFEADEDAIVHIIEEADQLSPYHTAAILFHSRWLTDQADA